VKKALILQGWYQKPSSNWYPWLKTKLEEKGYEVVIPDLPTIHTDFPVWKEIRQAIIDTNSLNENTLVIGHSLGCLMALRLAEEFKYRKMILVSGWDFNDLTPQHQSFWEKPIDHAKIINNVKEIICVGSDNDPYFTYCTTDEMSQRLHGKAVLVKGAGHFTEKFGVKEIPQILDFV